MRIVSCQLFDIFVLSMRYNLNCPASVNTALPRKRKRIIDSDSDVVSVVLVSRTTLYDRDKKEEKVTPNALDNAQAEIKSRYVSYT